MQAARRDKYRQPEVVALVLDSLFPDLLLLLLEHHGFAHHAHGWAVHTFVWLFTFRVLTAAGAAACLLLPRLRQGYQEVLLWTAKSACGSHGL